MNFDQRIWFGVWKEQFPPNFYPQHNSDSLFYAQDDKDFVNPSVQGLNSPYGN